jgi:hypothetical protein
VSSPPSAQPRCRHCGARLGAEDAWCSLCLTPTAEVVAAEAPRHRAEAAAPDQMIGDLTEDPSTLAVIRAHLALSELPGGKYTLALGGGVVLLLLLMAGLTVLGLLL